MLILTGWPSRSGMKWGFVYIMRISIEYVSNYNLWTFHKLMRYLLCPSVIDRSSKSIRSTKTSTLICTTYSCLSCTNLTKKMRVLMIRLRYRFFIVHLYCTFLVVACRHIYYLKNYDRWSIAHFSILLIFSWLFVIFEIVLFQLCFRFNFSFYSSVDCIYSFNNEQNSIFVDPSIYTDKPVHSLFFFWNHDQNTILFRPLYDWCLCRKGRQGNQ